MNLPGAAADSGEPGVSSVASRPHLPRPSHPGALFPPLLKLWPSPGPTRLSHRPEGPGLAEPS